MDHWPVTSWDDYINRAIIKLPHVFGDLSPNSVRSTHNPNTNNVAKDYNVEYHNMIYCPKSELGITQTRIDVGMFFLHVETVEDVLM